MNPAELPSPQTHRQPLDGHFEAAGVMLTPLHDSVDPENDRSPDLHQLVEAHDAAVLQSYYDLVRVAPDSDEIRPEYRHKTYFGTDFAREVSEAMANLGTFVEYPRLMYGTMIRLAETAESVDLGHLKYGLYGYAKVTESTIDHLDEQGSERFEYAGKIRRTMPVFLGELLKACDHHVYGRREAVRGWHKQFYSQAAREAPPALAMLDFMDAHERYDLGVALALTDTQEKHVADYLQCMNSILNTVAKRIVGKYATFSTVSSTLGIDRIGLWVAMQEVFAGRDDALETYCRMRGVADSADFAAIRQEQAERTARRTLSSIPGASRVFNIFTKVPLEEWDHEDALLLEPSLKLRRQLGATGVMRQAEVAP